MSELLRVLIIEDSSLDAKVLAGLLRAGGYEVFSERVETVSGVPARYSFSVVLNSCNSTLRDFDP